MKRHAVRLGACLVVVCTLGCVAHREADVVIAPTFSYWKAQPAAAPSSATIAAVPEADR
jgi:hypothetical protein